MGLGCDVKETERSHRVQIRLEHEVNFAMCTEPSRVPGFMNTARLLFFSPLVLETVPFNGMNKVILNCSCSYCRRFPH